MTYADFEAALVDAGQQHLVLKMEEYTAQEAEWLITAGFAGRPAACAAAESSLAGHIEGWLSGRYGELTPAAIFEQRPLLVQAWALSEVIGELCGRIITGNGGAKPRCGGCGREVGTHGDFCNGCEEAVKALPPNDD